MTFALPSTFWESRHTPLRPSLQKIELHVVLSKTVMIVVPLQNGRSRTSAALEGNHERSVKNYFAGNIPHR